MTDLLDTNHFRYCGEYLDAETGRYYLRARYYDPLIGRFTQRDTHWNTANMIYGDNPQKINEREDKLGLKTYSYAPQITAIMQAGNMYVYCLNSPITYMDESGHAVTVIMFAAWAAIAGVSGVIGGVSNLNNESGFWGGFAGGFLNGAISGGVGLFFPAYTALGTTLGASAGSLLTGFLNGTRSAELWSDVAISALVGLIFSGSLGAYINFAFGLKTSELLAIADLINMDQWTQTIVAIILGESVDAISYDISERIEEYLHPEH